MVRTLYFDCFSGISGDMTVGALIDLGLDFDYLCAELRKLPVEGFDLRLSRVERANVSATKFDVLVESDPGHHHHDGGKREHTQDHFHCKASEIINMIRDSGLGAGARKLAMQIFEKLAISEGKVHDLPPEDVEFHEVGAVDSIVDVVGTAIGLDALAIEQFLCSPINVGGGFIHCQHGYYPVPAPATANLLTNALVYSKHVNAELVTPTGAAILAGTIDRFGPMDGFQIGKIGYGAGTKEFDEFPNCLRLFLGNAKAELEDTVEDQIAVIEANIDDMSAENLAYAGERLLAAGALDVITIPIQMKKGRPGHLLQVLAPSGSEADLSQTMFEETTTIGIRMRQMSRKVLDREIVRVAASQGSVAVKVSRFNGKIVNVSPEYEDCARLARATGRPLKDIQAEILKTYFEKEQTGVSKENV